MKTNKYIISNICLQRKFPGIFIEVIVQTNLSNLRIT